MFENDKLPQLISAERFYRGELVLRKWLEGLEGWAPGGGSRSKSRNTVELPPRGFGQAAGARGQRPVAGLRHTVASQHPGPRVHAPRLSS